MGLGYGVTVYLHCQFECLCLFREDGEAVGCHHYFVPYIEPAFLFLWIVMGIVDIVENQENAELPWIQS